MKSTKSREMSYEQLKAEAAALDAQTKETRKRKRRLNTKAGQSKASFNSYGFSLGGVAACKSFTYDEETVYRH